MTSEEQCNTIIKLLEEQLLLLRIIAYQQPFPDELLNEQITRDELGNIVFVKSA